jgi:hypothetical protein
MSYLYDNPNGFIIVFGFPPRYAIRFNGVCQDEVVDGKMLALMFTSGFEVVSNAFFQHLSLLYGNMSSITCEFEYIMKRVRHVDNP